MPQTEQGIEFPDFAKLADEVLADVAAGNLPNDTRELLATHGRLMFSEGLQAAARHLCSLAESVDDSAEEIAGGS
jgi:hypothetical protein